MRLSTRGEYSLRLMMELAKNYNGISMPLKSISKAQDISYKYLGQLIIPLKIAGLIKSIRGINGGYFLSRPPDKIRLIEILEATEGSLYIAECVESPEICKRSRNCISRQIWKEISEAILNSIRSISLKDIINRDIDKQVIDNYSI